MCLLRADQTYDGRAYANPNEMLRIAEKSPCVSTDIRQIPTVPRPESRFSPAWATAIRRCREPRSEEEQAEALAQAEYEDDLGIERDPATYTILRAQNAEDAKREAEEQCAVSQRLTRSATI
jgi:hypothetical protein